MSKFTISPGEEFFGNLVSLDCHIHDLKLILRKTEEIKLPDYEETIEDDILILDIFPDITRKSFIVTLLILLDGEFKSYCNILKDATDQNLKWTDLKGSALERYTTYSEKVCGLNAICEDLIRQKLIGLIEIRNCIVHNNSMLKDFRKHKVIENFSKQMTGVNIQEDYITLELEACNKCADIVLQFMEQAYNSALEIFPR